MRRIFTPGKTLPLLASLFALAAPALAGPNDSAWISLFNKADTSMRTNWDVKIRGESVNSDPRRTFRWAVSGTDTVVEVNYAGYTGSFNGDAGPFGHAAYKLRTFSYYLLRSEYQVWGAQYTGGPGWANQNSGFMLHSQPMTTMTLNQDFPVSIEAQLLGPGNGSGTMNLCTPGTAFYSNPTGGSVNTSHCVNAAANARAALNTGWQSVSALILGDSIHRYYAGADGSQLVHTYYRTVYYSGNIANPPSGLPANGTRLASGYITIQSESHPFRFRKIEVLDLQGCMTPGDVNYKSYLVKHDSAACGGTSGLRGASPSAARHAAPLAMVGDAIKVDGTARVALEVYDMRGTLVGAHSAQAPFQWTPPAKAAGLHVIRATTPQGTYAEKVLLSE